MYFHEQLLDDKYQHDEYRYGAQYISIRYTNCLEAANLLASVGTIGDSYDNALAKAVNWFMKSVCIVH